MQRFGASEKNDRYRIMLTEGLKKHFYISKTIYNFGVCHSKGTYFPCPEAGHSIFCSPGGRTFFYQVRQIASDKKERATVMLRKHTYHLEVGSQKESLESVMFHFSSFSSSPSSPFFPFYSWSCHPSANPHQG